MGKNNLGRNLLPNRTNLHHNAVRIRKRDKTTIIIPRLLNQIFQSTFK